MYEDEAIATIQEVADGGAAWKEELKEEFKESAGGWSGSGDKGKAQKETECFA